MTNVHKISRSAYTREKARSAIREWTVSAQHKYFRSTACVRRMTTGRRRERLWLVFTAAGASSHDAKGQIVQRPGSVKKSRKGQGKVAAAGARRGSALSTLHLHLDHGCCYRYGRSRPSGLRALILARACRAHAPRPARDLAGQSFSTDHQRK